MIEQRHPSQRVTPVEVGDAIAWTKVSDGAGFYFEGRTPGPGAGFYVVAPRDDVFEAVRVSTALGHGGPRPHRQTIRLCQTAEDAMAACQDAEHVAAWALLSETARALLLGTVPTVAAVA